MPPLAMLQHVRQARCNAVVDGGEVHGDGVIPFVVLGLARLAQGLHARVVHDQVQVAELVVHFGEQLHPAVAIRHVVLDRNHARIAGLEERHRGLHAFFVAIADHDLHARVRSGARNAETDAVGRRRDVRDLAFEILERRRLRHRRLRRRRGACAARRTTGRRRVLRDNLTRKAREHHAHAGRAQCGTGSEELTSVERLVVLLCLAHGDPLLRPSRCGRTCAPSCDARFRADRCPHAARARRL